jgi:hypothetical protein
MPRGRQSSLQLYRDQLLQRRDQIDAQLEAIEQIMAGMGGMAVRSSRAGDDGGAVSSGARAGSLKEFIVQVLRGRGVMRVAEITNAIKRAGYKTKNKTLSHSVSVALTEIPGAKKVGRGQFRMN